MTWPAKPEAKSMLETYWHQSILEIRLARPPVNAINSELLAALNRQLDTVAKGGQARGLILSGQAGVFSAGLDVKELIQLKQNDIKLFWSEFFGLVHRLMAAEVPVAAALTGHSPAGGAILAAHCDYRVGAAGDYRIGFNEVQVGLPVPSAILATIARMTGGAAAGGLTLTGRMVSMDEAHKLGVLDDLVAPEQVVPTCLTWTGIAAAGSRSAVAETRKNLWRQALDQLDVDHEAEAAACWWFRKDTQSRIKQLAESL